VELKKFNWYRPNNVQENSFLIEEQYAEGSKCNKQYCQNNFEKVNKTIMSKQDKFNLILCEYAQTELYQ